MSECTAAERALLEALASGGNTREARLAFELERRGREQFETVVRLRLAAAQAEERSRSASVAFCGYGSFSCFLDAAIDEEVNRRRAVSEAKSDG